jgi:hypothetical protein
VIPDKSAEAVLEGDHIVIRVRIDCLKTALPVAEERAGYVSHSTIVSDVGFAADVIAELNKEDEDGTTPIHDLFDNAMLGAVENGSEHVIVPDDNKYDEEDN